MAAAAIKSCCIAVLVVVSMALPAPASSSSPRTALLQQLDMAAARPAQELQAEMGGLKGAEEEEEFEFGSESESEREVPTGPDPIHHHGRGPRRQSP